VCRQGNYSDVIQLWTAGGTTSPPRELSWINLNSSCSQLRWKPPEFMTGFILHYQVENTYFTPSHVPEWHSLTVYVNHVRIMCFFKNFLYFLIECIQVLVTKFICAFGFCSTVLFFWSYFMLGRSLKKTSGNCSSRFFSAWVVLPVTRVTRPTPSKLMCIVSTVLLINWKMV